jgi:cyclopropane fatty-acyl-phospholipid synthase-like methyltransferase
MARTNIHEGWRAFFDGHAPFYMQNVFTRNTRAEVEFLVEELRLTTGDRVLDVGCGTGRHAVPLARRGCRMVGIDSRGMLRRRRPPHSRHPSRRCPGGCHALRHAEPL